ncbi:albusnodin family lasso peptide [Nocardiopsis dassonvillei]
MDENSMTRGAEADELIIDLGDAAALTLGEGSDDNEDKRKIYN